MTIQEMRKSISKLYPGQKWKDKVENMKDQQVFAIYYSYVHKGNLNPEKPKFVEPVVEEEKLVSKIKGVQMTIFDISNEHNFYA